jgi:tryptophanyl-tRNA synthetase
LFYFKFVDPKGLVLLQSLGFASPKDAGQTIAQLQAEGPACLAAIQDRLAPIDATYMHLIFENWQLLAAIQADNQK